MPGSRCRPRKCFTQTACTDRRTCIMQAAGAYSAASYTEPMCTEDTNRARVEVYAEGTYHAECAPADTWTYQHIPA